MDSSQRINWTFQWCCILVCVAFLSAVGGSAEESCSESDKQKERFLMLVSTLDGRMTALEVGTGNQEWSVETGNKALLSSSISSFEMVRDGSPIRLIPSLDGALYQYDGTGIEPVPLAANLLLSNSFRFSDDSTVVGGEEVETYGMDMKTGKLKYVCAVSGCKKFGENNSAGETAKDLSDGDTLVITRRTKTVRTVHMKSGQEKWNFSVGQHELSYIKDKGTDKKRDGLSERNNLVEGTEESEPCSVANEGEGFFDGFDFHWFTPEEDGTKYSPDDLQVKVIVPSGIVVAVLKKNPSQVIWQQKFEVAIANAWLLKGDDLFEVNLFDNDNIPALSFGNPSTIPGEDTDDDDSDKTQALLYVGVYDNQVYVQPSHRLMQDVHDATTRAVITGDTRAIHMPRVHWNPYLATAVSRTPILNPSLVKQGGVKQIEFSNGEVIESTPDKDVNPKVTVTKAQYPFDEGVYLLQEYTPMSLPEDRRIEDRSGQPADMPYISLYLLNYWPIFILSVVVPILIHLAFMKYLQKPQIVERSSSSVSQSAGSESNNNSNTSEKTSSSKEETSAEPTEYISRFYTDFDPLAVLGRGGFGIVFESCNRLDDCVYAIKRIALNKSDRAKEKVMREVKALAKLDHTGIVRYHQSWFENPPTGWQEERDKNFQDMPSSTPGGYSMTDGPTSPAETTTPPEGGVIRRYSQLYLCNLDKDWRMGAHGNPMNINPMKPFREESTSFPVRSEVDEESWANDKESPEESNDKSPALTRVGSSGSFVPHGATFEIGDSEDSDEDGEETEEEEESGLGNHSSKVSWLNDDSFEVVFNDNTEEGSQISHQGEAQNPPTPKLPFHAYKIDSSETETESVASLHGASGTDQTESVDVVFEDSGCSDRMPGNGGVPDESLDLNQPRKTSHSHRSKSFSPLPGAPLDCIKEHEASPVKTPQGHRKSASLDITKSTATRPSDLPLDRTHEGGVSSHPVPKLYLYIQMQLCRRESLKDWLTANTKDRDRLLLLDIFHQIVTAMDYVHDKGLMHRDLKPSNIFFSMDGIVKIGDFGLVTAQEENCGSPYECGLSPANQLHTGQVGTKLYMSPEQNAGKHYTHKVDTYAMGLIFFELFVPFDTQMERVRLLMDAKRQRFPETFIKQFSKDEVIFAKRLLSHDPDHRPSTKEILAQQMFESFEVIVKAYTRARARTSSRIRTYSTSSNHSGSGSGSQSSPEIDSQIRFS